MNRVKFGLACIVGIAVPCATSHAEPAEVTTPQIQIHGFVSEGGFYSTDNDVIGHSSRGSLEFFQAALNVSTELTDKLHAGLQLFSQDEGTSNDATPRLDWAYLDYRLHPWLGIRAGRVRIPFGLYNDYVDIDAARVQILLPQSIYPITDRNILTAQTGFALYGARPSKEIGTISYQAYAGVLSFPISPAQDANNTRFYKYDSHYLAGVHAFWHPPFVEGLRIGESYLRTSLDYYLNLSPSLLAQLQMSGAVPPDFNGNVTLDIRPAELWATSAEYAHDKWLVAAEYSRWFTRSRSEPINLLPSPTSESERFYGMVTYQWCECLALGAYYSVLNQNVDDRSGSNLKAFPRHYYAWSRDAAATLRYDVNDHWLWKIEAHYIDGAAAVDRTLDPLPTRFWGLFLVRTTVTF